MTASRTLPIARLLVAVGVLATHSAGKASAQPVPRSWQVSDIGGPAGPKPKSTCANDLRCLTSVTTRESDASETADRLTFVNIPFSGEGVFITRVDAIERGASVHAGLMVRESLSPGAKHVFASTSDDGALRFQFRESTGAARETVIGNGGAGDHWLKLVRAGNQFTMYHSDDGAEWSEVARQSVVMPNTISVGLAVSSTEETHKSTARFSLTGINAGLPSDWDAIDIGTAAGGATVSSGNWFSVTSLSDAISGTSDDFRYTFRRATGDVSIVARISELPGRRRDISAGLMIRRALHPSAAHASILVSPGGVSFNRRLVATADTLESNGGTDGAPIWLKLERRGTRITALRSSDGAQWTPVGEDSLQLGEEFFVGLVLAGQNRGEMAGAVFEGVRVKETPHNVAPTVTLSSPTPGTVVAAGTPLVVAANAKDSDGVITGVDFVGNGVLLTTDTTAPYSFTWKPAAGDYVIEAVARDDKGGQTTSTGATVSVRAAASTQNAPPTVTLSSPQTGALLTSGVPLQIAAFAFDSDGTVVAVDFTAGGVVIGSDATAPYDITWVPPDGDYVLAAVARDDKGATTTSPTVNVSVRTPPASTPDTSAPSSPWLLLFSPSPDDATVDFYQLEIFKTSIDSGSAVLVLNLGKPVPVDGVVSVDVTAIVAALPTAEYVAVVQAIGVSGVGASAPSPTFTP